MDVAVPLSRYSEIVAFAREEVKDLVAYVFGHAGDGNVHVVVMDNPEDKGRWARVEEANRKIVLKALELEGTCTGEHGVGIGKRAFLQIEHGEGLALMQRIKAFLPIFRTLLPALWPIFFGSIKGTGNGYGLMLD
jgi:D-lactate dehydrogenase (cytochrome)